jgi:hypothetical protein
VYNKRRKYFAKFKKKQEFQQKTGKPAQLV